MKKPSADFFRFNKVRLVQGGREFFDLLLGLIDSARESIQLQVYIFDADETGTRVADALTRAAARGVKVYMLVDAYGSQALPKDVMLGMRNAGVNVRKFQPLLKSRKFYLGRRLHHKVVVVDSRHALVAGLNISNRYNDMPDQPAWLDWALHAEGEVAAALDDLCRNRMMIRKKRQPAPVVRTDGECAVAIRVNDWVRRKRQIYSSYLRRLRDATASVTLMSAYFLPGRQLRRRIAEAARRGVKVRVILTGHADVFLIKYAERYIYRWLFRHNIEVYEYRKNVLHAKLGLSDSQWLTVGSFNVNNLSTFGSIELNLEVYDRHCVAEAEKRIERIVREDCQLITESTFNRTYNLFHRTVHRSAYELFRFLFFVSTKKQGD